MPSSSTLFSRQKAAVPYSQVLKAANLACEKQKAKFTELREQVLNIIWQHQKPIGAYDIMAKLEQMSERHKVAPPTVYRSLEFLQRMGLIHHIHSLNAFMVKSHPSSSDAGALFICRDCGETHESINSVFQQAINLSANEMKFKVQEHAIEVLGQCQACRAKAAT